jgi:hypothetical protein
MGEYTPELGQLLFGCPTGRYDVPDYGVALIEWCMKEIERVYWNRNQREWDRYTDPQIPGIIYRPYYWGDDEVEMELPNFQLEGNQFEIRWYKHCWRGVSCNINYTPGQWVEWFDEVIKRIQRYDKNGRRY